jgi:Plasmid encoded RepA protein
MANTPKVRGFVTPGNVLPRLDFLAPTLQHIEQTKAPTVQRRYHFNRYKQIQALHQLAEDEKPDMGFMTRLLKLCSLPRTDPGDRLQYIRRNGPYKLVMIAGGDNKLPFGNLPRLLLAWVCTQAKKNHDANPDHPERRKLYLGTSFAAFMEQLGIKNDSGGSRGDRTRLRKQIDRLFNAHLDLIYEDDQGKFTTGGRIAPKTLLWWDYHNPDQQSLWKSWVEIGEELFNEIIAHPVPLDMNILKELRRSSLGLDLYMWLSYKTFYLYTQKRKPDRLSWPRLYIQFGADPSKADDSRTVDDFRKDALRELKKLKLAWPALNYDTPKGYLEIRPCAPSIPPKALPA